MAAIPSGASCAQARKSFFHALADGGNIPAKAIPIVAGGIGEAVDETNFRLTVDPAQQGNTTAFRAQIHGHQRRLASALAASLSLQVPIARNLIHRRKASVRPPSTGMMWPVVQGDFGPARNRIASAQSFGSIGR